MQEMQETWVQSLGRKIPWSRRRQPTPVFLPGKNLWTEEPGELQSIGLQRVGHNWACTHEKSIARFAWEVTQASSLRSCLKKSKPLWERTSGSRMVSKGAPRTGGPFGRDTGVNLGSKSQWSWWESASAIFSHLFGCLVLGILMKNEKRDREFTCASGGRNFPSSLLVGYALSSKTSSARGPTTQLGGPWLCHCR